MKKKTTRLVRLHRKYRNVEGSLYSKPLRAIPWLNISGVWLEEAGFNAGDAVEITIKENTLIIKNCSCNGNKKH